MVETFKKKHFNGGTRILPTDHQETDGFVRPEVQYPDKDYTWINARRRRRSITTYDRLRHRQWSITTTTKLTRSEEKRQIQQRSTIGDRRPKSIRNLTIQGFGHWLDFKHHKSFPDLKRPRELWPKIPWIPGTWLIWAETIKVTQYKCRTIAAQNAVKSCDNTVTLNQLDAVWSWQ